MSSNQHEQKLVYDWNTRKRRHPLTEGSVMLQDETLRDGIQGPSVKDPTIEEKKRFIELSAALGIHSINLGLPGAGPRAVEHVTELAEFIIEKKLPIKANCAARTHLNDVRPIAEISQKVGMQLEVMAFLGTSPIRRFVEEWEVEKLLKFSSTAIEFAVGEGLPVTFVTEDTVRSTPQDLSVLFRNAIECGIHRLTLCDTVGHATPDGVKNLIEFTKDIIESSGREVGIDWHGHNDRGLALTNTLTAMEYGATRLHGTALGIGERVGNASLDQLLVNLKLLGEFDGDLTNLPEWVKLISEATDTPIPKGYPVVGTDAFRTATGVHAAAVIKAEKKGEDFLADRVYSGVPASMVGESQRIEVGPMSGLSNVLYWLDKNGYEVSDELAQAVFAGAKAADHVLTDDEVHALAKAR
ncbi:MAG: LeuA family protein [Deltaproteobacteria bacterium]|nr:LeuA family protein [Deltaproteobacteria bacterium]